MANEEERHSCDVVICLAMLCVVSTLFLEFVYIENLVGAMLGVE